MLRGVSSQQLSYLGLDFKQQVFKDSTWRGYSDIITLSAPSPKWVWNAQGQLVEVPAGQPAFGYDRFTGEPLGQIIESVDATNVLLNSFAPATQTVSVSDATTYTLSVYGSGSAEITAGGSGTATDGSPLTFTTTGTSVTVTVTGSLDVFQLETGSVVTSPIETTGSAVTRAADVVSANAAFVNNYDPAQGWLFIDYELVLGRWIFQSHVDSLNSNSILILEDQITVASTETTIVSGDFTGRNAVLLKWTSGQLVVFVNGSEIFRGEVAMPSSDKARFFLRANDGNPSNGHLFNFQMGDTISDADAIARTRL